MTDTTDPATAPVVTADATTPVVELRGVHKALGGRPVLAGVDLALPPDSITTVLGPSGTGKSVLLKHIVGLVEPDRGSVAVLGQELGAMPERERLALRTRVGVLFQDGALFGSLDVYDNVAFPLRKHTDLDEDAIDEKVMRALDEVGLSDAVDRAPGELSGGMRKRAGFARALILEPEVVLFDEPDSGLDPVRTSLLNDLIRRLHAEHGGAYVLVTHDIDTARTVSDHVGLLHRGRLRQHGPAAEVFASDDPLVRQFLAGDSAGPLGMD